MAGDDEVRQLAGHFFQKTLARHVTQQVQAAFVTDAQHNPRFGRGHDARRPFGIGRGLEGPDLGFQLEMP